MDEEGDRIARVLRDQAVEMERQRIEDEASKPHCWLITDPQWGGCCCECENRVSDYDNDTGRRIGFICMAPEFFDQNGVKVVYSHWDPHGFCEMFAKRTHRNRWGAPVEEPHAETLEAG